MKMVRLWWHKIARWKEVNDMNLVMLWCNAIIEERKTLRDIKSRRLRRMVSEELIAQGFPELAKEQA